MNAGFWHSTFFQQIPVEFWLLHFWPVFSPWAASDEVWTAVDESSEDGWVTQTDAGVGIWSPLTEVQTGVWS